MKKYIAISAVVALGAAGLTASNMTTAGAHSGHGSGHYGGHSGKLTLMVRSAARDLQATADPTDGIRGRVEVRHGRRTSTVKLRVAGFGSAATGSEFGAHVHSGPCVAGNGAAAGPHYNSDVIAGDTTPEISDRTEVWLDFVVGSRGTAKARATVPFTLLPGDRSVVIHAMPTAPDGTAGTRLACFPVVW